MGIFYSSEPPPPPPPPLLDKPWLEMGDRRTDLQFLNNYKPERNDQQQFRILLVGLVGAGKSSFINSVMSALEGGICRRAVACNISGTSFTNEYKSYSIKKGNQRDNYPFVLNDMMGLEDTSRRHRRVLVKDLKKAMKGHIMNGYKFNPESSLSKNDPFYKKNPTIDDKVHVLVSVINANTVNLLSVHVNNTIQDMRDDATVLGIPHVVILTKIDEACPEIKKDLKNVCKSRYLREKVQEVSRLVGIPENCIFPVKTYSSETKLNDDVDTLVLNALTHIIKTGEEQLNK